MAPGRPLRRKAWLSRENQAFPLSIQLCIRFKRLAAHANAAVVPAPAVPNPLTGPVAAWAVAVIAGPVICVRAGAVIAVPTIHCGAENGAGGEPANDARGNASAARLRLLRP